MLNASYKKASLNRGESRFICSRPFRVPTVFTLCSTVDAQSTLVSTHPDAVKRRQEAEAYAKKRQQQKQEQLDLDAAKVKWWQQEYANILIVQTPKQLAAAIESTKKEGKLLIAKFFKEDCYACRSLHPKLIKIASSYPNITFVKINGTCPQLHQLCQDLGVQVVPFFQFYKGGELVAAMTASMNPEKLAAFRNEIAIQSLALQR